MTIIKILTVFQNLASNLHRQHFYTPLVHFYITDMTIEYLKLTFKGSTTRKECSVVSHLPKKQPFLKNIYIYIRIIKYGT